MFSYKVSVYHIRSGIKIAECEASCNSKEKKYATRTVWEKNEKGVNVKKTEETPIYDIINTLMKMAQKRGIVGGVKDATGASDYFTCDIDDEIDAQQLGVIPNGSIEPTVKDPTNFSVNGNTQPHKETLKSLGGKWNLNVKCWDFKNVDISVKEKVLALNGVKEA